MLCNRIHVCPSSFSSVDRQKPNFYFNSSLTPGTEIHCGPENLLLSSKKSAFHCSSLNMRVKFTLNHFLIQFESFTSINLNYSSNLNSEIVVLFGFGEVSRSFTNSFTGGIKTFDAFCQILIRHMGT